MKTVRWLILFASAAVVAYLLLSTRGGHAVRASRDDVPVINPIANP